MPHRTAIDAPHRVQQEHPQAAERHELDGNAAALVAIEVELPADRSRPDAGLVTLSGLIGGGNRVLHDSRDQLLMCVL